MKGRKMGPGTSGPAKGDKDWDHEQKPVARNKAPKIMAAAKARKDGGKASGDAPMKNGGRMPRIQPEPGLVRQDGQCARRAQARWLHTVTTSDPRGVP